MKQSIPIEGSRFATEGLAACVHQAVVMSEDGYDVQLVDLARTKTAEIELKMMISETGGSDVRALAARGDSEVAAVSFRLRTMLSALLSLRQIY